MIKLFCDYFFKINKNNRYDLINVPQVFFQNFDRAYFSYFEFFTVEF